MWKISPVTFPGGSRSVSEVRDYFIERFSHALLCRSDRDEHGPRSEFIPYSKVGPISCIAVRRCRGILGPPYVPDVACPVGSHGVGRLTQDRALLYQGMRAAYGAVLAAVTGSLRRFCSGRRDMTVDTGAGTSAE